MPSTDARPPRFLAAAVEHDHAPAPATFRPLREAISATASFARRIETPSAPAAHFGPLHPAVVAPPPFPEPPWPEMRLAPPLPPDYSGLTRAMDALRMQGERLAADARSDALEIGFQVARRILEMEITAGPEPLFALIRSALKKAGEVRSVRVRLHPEDLLRVEAAGGPTRLTNFTILSVDLVPDDTLGHGDCVVETDFGSVDGRLNSRLDELKRGVQGALAEEAA